jgi:hypothetical protein
MQWFMFQLTIFTFVRVPSFGRVGMGSVPRHIRRPLSKEHAASTGPLVSLVLIMRPAAQLNVVIRRRPAVRVRHHVVELEEASLAAATFSALERAAAAVPSPDSALHRRRNVTRLSDASTRGTRALRGSHFGPLQMLDEQCQRPIEDCCRIAVRHRMPQEILRAAQFVVCLAADGELHFVALGRERHDRPSPHDRTLRPHASCTSPRERS